uniref:Uncharacterized protein n=1 Tax=Muribaculaceae bacterium Z82 TaxID=2304548 RepID=A0A7C9NBX3_9BACT
MAGIDYDLHTVAGKLALCAQALREANQTLPSGLPPCDDGTELWCVYFGAEEAVREALATVRGAMAKV